MNIYRLNLREFLNTETILFHYLLPTAAPDMLGLLLPFQG